jgi:alkylglycerol monooxygenase
MFYLPLAFFVRPSVAYMHMQFNTLYQFWIHTEEIKSLGPLECIINTPSHHRVHHGRNRYAIDKNYGGTLIIWDRMFGTFAAERTDEELAYGLVHPINTFDGNDVQLIWYRYIFKDLVPRMNTVTAKFAAIFYGPGWSPERPHLRLGEITDIPDIKGPTPVYNPKLSKFMSIYSVVQFTFCVLLFQSLVLLKEGAVESVSTAGCALAMTAGIAYMISSFAIVGRCFDDEAKNTKYELIRVIVSAGLSAIIGIRMPVLSVGALVCCLFNAVSMVLLLCFGSRTRSVKTE